MGYRSSAQFRQTSFPETVSVTPRRKNPYDLAFLAGALEKARHGSGFDAFEYHEIEAILHSVLAISDRVPRSERSQIVAATINHAAQAGTITKDGLTTGLRRAERQFLGTKPFKAVLVVPVSISLPPTVHRKVLFRGQLTIARWIPAAFRAARASSRPRIPEADQQHDGYSWFLARYRGRSTREAYEVTLRHVDLARAFWNYTLNRRTLMRFSSGAQQPVNEIRLGRAYTLHAPGGKSLKAGYWDDPSFMQRRNTFVSAADWKSMNVAARRLGARLHRHPYRRTLESAFIRYVRALDTIDFESGFIKLWALLEMLTATSNAHYDTTVKRALFVFEEREFMRHVLEHLRDERNSSVHDDAGSDQAQTYVFQLKVCVEQLIAFHLNAGRRYGALAEACALLDQPQTKAELLGRIRLARDAIAFQQL